MMRVHEPNEHISNNFIDMVHKIPNEPQYVE